MASVLNSKEFFLLVVICTLGCPLCMPLETCRRISDVFQTEPIDITAKEGDSVVFTCAAGNFSQGTDSITWSVKPTQYHDVIINNTFDSEKGIMTSQLLLHNISKIDCYVTCILNISLRPPDEHQWDCFLSREAELDVLYFPKSNEISCGPQELQQLTEGSVFSVRCEVARCNPAVDIYWELDFNVQEDIQLPRSTLDDDGLTRTSRLNLHVRKQMHLRSLVCIVTSELNFPEKKLKCPVGPIKVIHPPRVFVNPPRLLLTNKHPMQLECLVDGYPDNFTFSWSCSGTGTLQGCGGMSNKVNLSINDLQAVRIKGTYVQVMCRVHNSVGTGKASSIIKLERQNSFDRTLNHCDQLPSNFTVSGEFFGQHIPRKFTCIFQEQQANSTSRLDSFQTVLMNDTEVSDNLDYNIEEELFPANLSLGLFTVTKASYNETVLCEITLHKCNYTHLAFAKISSPAANLEMEKISSQSVDIKTTVDSNLVVIMETSDIEGNAKDLFWQTATIVIGSVLATVVLIVCIATMKYVEWHKRKKHSNKRLDTGPGTAMLQNQPAAADPVYEMLTEPGVINVEGFPQTVTMPRVRHTYDLGVQNSLAPSLSSKGSCSSDMQQMLDSTIHHTYDSSLHNSLTQGIASEGSCSCSCDMQLVHTYYGVEKIAEPQMTCKDPLEKVLYSNEYVVGTNSDNKDKKFNSNIMKLAGTQENAYEVPLSQIPQKTREHNSNSKTE